MTTEAPRFSRHLHQGQHRNFTCANGTVVSVEHVIPGTYRVLQVDNSVMTAMFGPDTGGRPADMTARAAAWEYANCLAADNGGWSASTYDEITAILTDTTSELGDVNTYTDLCLTCGRRGCSTQCLTCSTAADAPVVIDALPEVQVHADELDRRLTNLADNKLTDAQRGALISASEDGRIGRFNGSGVTSSTLRALANHGLGDLERGGSWGVITGLRLNWRGMAIRTKYRPAN